MHHPARALAAILVATLGLAACTASEPEAQTQSAEPTDEPSTEPTEAAEPEAPVPANGEVLTTQEQIDAAKAAGLEVYTMNDGTKVAIDPEQPLPQPVVAEGVAEAQARWQGDMMAVEAQAGSWIRETKKNIAFIIPIYGSKDGITDEMLWIVAGVSNPSSPLYYRDSGYPGSTADVNAQIAWAEQWVATRPASENWQVIVTPAP